MIWQLCIEIKFRSPKRLLEHFIQILYKQLVTPHQFDQIRNIVLYIPTVYPGIIFTIIFTGTLSSGKNIVKRHDKITFVIFRMEKFGLLVE
ncbi:hypothetical protein D3C81_1340150 [compost metagenome]